MTAQNKKRKCKNTLLDRGGRTSKLLQRGCEMGRRRQTMQIVIEIPEDVYKSIQDKEFCGISHMGLYNAIANGTPLPKGHGRLIDADAFIKAECSQCDGYCDVCDCDCLNCKSEYRCDFIKNIDSADVIIEADEEVDE